MPKKIFYNKLTLLAITILLFSSIQPISAFNTPNEKNSEVITNKNCEKTNISIECTTYGLGPTDTITKTHITTHQAHQIQTLLAQLQQTLYHHPTSPDIQTLQNQIITTAQNLNLVPTNIPKTIFKPIKNSPFLPHLPRPYAQHHATEYLCNYLSFGEGSAMPVIVLPRLIPILLTPIPRIYFKWNAAEGYTTCGGIRSGTGFQAYGQQTGTALGFWGIGFSIFLPPIRTYAILGYALHAKVDAEQIELYPPNYPPTTEPNYPLNQATNIPLATTELAFTIADQNNDPLSYSITTHPDIGSTNIHNVTPGTYSIPIHNLEGTQEYTWTIQITDGEHTIENIYSFTTEEVAPKISNPTPPNGETFVPTTIPNLQFYLQDPQHDLMNYTVETTPYIGSGSGNILPDGYYTIPVTNLKPTTQYTWYINATDGTHWKHVQYTFQTEPIMHFNPFNNGWQYQKTITLNQSKINGPLTNFPILLTITDDDIKNKAQPDGDDILFMNNTGKAHRLWHEIENYDSTTGTLTCWINLPTITTTSANSFVLYYGNNTASSQQFPPQVWNSHYMAVWHLQTTPTSPIPDSTQNNNHGTAAQTMTTSNIIPGKIGYATDFDGLDDYINIPDSQSLKPQDITLSIWYKPHTSETGGMIVSKGSVDYWGNTDGHTYAIANSNTIQASLEKKNTEQYDRIGIHNKHLNQWQQLTLTYSKTTKTATFYVNGQLNDQLTPCHTTVLWYNQPWDFIIAASKQGTGSGHTPTSFQNCALDEIRISNTTLTPEWIQTEYNNQHNPTTFYTIGTEETK